MIVSNPSHRIVTTIIVPMTAAKALISTPAVVLGKCTPAIFNYNTSTTRIYLEGVALSRKETFSQVVWEKGKGKEFAGGVG
jgi:hypothetical protein